MYAFRIFELLIQYLPIGKRTMTIKEIGEWCGIERDQYKLYTNFKKRVLERACEEINNRTDYEVDYVEIKEGRKVATIEWSIKEKINKKTIDAGNKEYSTGSGCITNTYELPQNLSSEVEVPKSKNVIKEEVKKLEEKAIKAIVNKNWQNHHTEYGNDAEPTKVKTKKHQAAVSIPVPPKEEQKTFVPSKTFSDEIKKDILEWAGSKNDHEDEIKFKNILKIIRDSIGENLYNSLFSSSREPDLYKEEKKIILYVKEGGDSPEIIAYKIAHYLTNLRELGFKYEVKSYNE